MKSASGKLWCVSVISLFLSGTVCADTIFESATVGQHGGSTVGNTGGTHQFLGVRFSLSNAVIAQSIGGEIRGLDNGSFTSSGNVFGAIIALPNSSSFPQSMDPLNSADVLATAVIPVSAGYSDTSASIGPILLQPGEYALLFGGDQFGASGVGAAYGGTDIGSPSYFAGSVINGAYQNGGFFGERFFLDGVAAAPLPSSALAGLVLLGIIAVRPLSRRRFG